MPALSTDTYAVLEAQTVELPVVLAGAEGLGENVADGATGLVVTKRYADISVAAR
ncbi:MAG: hypothetical protein ACFCVK_04725 [Acidimicrobiales bacterium]